MLFAFINHCNHSLRFFTLKLSYFLAWYDITNFIFYIILLLCLVIFFSNKNLLSANYTENH